ncbi:hypothetical protein BDW62DRAFT_139575 [Aspergillus aurantiobrunneus]
MIMEGLCQQGKTESTGSGKNFECIRKTLVDTEFINRPVCGYMMRKPDPPSDLFCAVQLAITYLALDPVMSVCCLRTDYNIHAVYACAGTERGLIDDHFTVSTNTALDIRNFWLRHLLNPDEGTFYTSYMNLPDYNRPAVPSLIGFSLTEKRKFHHSWLGHESCICPAEVSDIELRQTCADLNGHMAEVEHITLQLEEHPDSESWLDIFEEYVAESERWDDLRTFFRGTQTYHGSGGDRSVPVRGFIDDIYGGGMGDCWLCICFVAYETPEYGSGHQRGSGSFFNETWPRMDMSSDFTSINGYEGVVVPGSSLVVGHWWDPRADEDSGAKGPFIFWCI